MGATWNLELMRAGGAMIGGEARAKGFNVLLAGGMNLMRDPRNGRTFEYLGEDPLHTGLMAGAAVSGIQSTAYDFHRQAFRTQRPGNGTQGRELQHRQMPRRAERPARLPDRDRAGSIRVP